MMVLWKWRVRQLCIQFKLTTVPFFGFDPSTDMIHFHQTVTTHRIFVVAFDLLEPRNR